MTDRSGIFRRDLGAPGLCVRPARGAWTAPGRATDSAASRSAAPATPLPAPLPSAPRTASPAPPHPAPSSLHERKWESQRRGPAETKHRGGRGGAAAGGKPRNQAGRAGPRSPPARGRTHQLRNPSRVPRPRCRAGWERRRRGLQVQRLSGGVRSQTLSEALPVR
ncbi:ATP synthase-coupling factor 6, mitochondrial isoform X2 [Mastomys coucha]|uniref:ATP synthase-coupling factor 6, mitochondrial isoform X2 n=1 Tax=Mastomys coucha TaxID=35658 RepID=UPI001261E652|nr:ATP synthase-coupling factor 6, mitochondrial isoform X2 [Mastomys coucha]